MSNNIPYPFESQRYYAQKPETVVRMQDLWRVINDLKVIWNEVDPTATPGTGTVTSVDLSMPSAFTVTGNPITTAGTLTVTGAGSSSDYIDGTGALQPFPSIGTGTVTSVAIAPGTAISVSGSPITTSGTITITNTAPDQTVVLTGGTGISITGTYPNFTITNSSPSSGGTVTSVAASAGTGISITGSPITTSGTLNITNTAPDQTVVLTAGTGIGITGTYPNFTITNSSPSSGGTVTSITASSPLTGGTITSSGSIGIQDAVADGATKGAASFTASDFNSSSGVISIDYANGQRASATDPGFLSAADWNTFNNKGSGTVTSVSALTLGTSGTDLSSTVANSTTTPVITLNVPDASSSARGVITTGAQTIAGAKTFSTAPILSSLTASQILATDGSKNVQTLTTATYPSLTELSYVKGATSAIQTQIDAKQNSLLYNKSTIDQSTSSNTLTNITNLSISIGASETIYFKAVIKVDCSAANGANYSVTVPSGATLNAYVMGQTTTAIGQGATSVTPTNWITSSGTASGTINAVATSNMITIVEGWVTTSGTSGTIQIQGRTANVANTVTFKSGSWITGFKAM